MRQRFPYRGLKLGHPSGTMKTSGQTRKNPQDLHLFWYFVMTMSHSYTNALSVKLGTTKSQIGNLQSRRGIVGPINWNSSQRPKPLPAGFAKDPPALGGVVISWLEARAKPSVGSRAKLAPFSLIQHARILPDRLTNSHTNT